MYVEKKWEETDQISLPTLSPWHTVKRHMEETKLLPFENWKGKEDEIAIELSTCRPIWV